MPFISKILQIIRNLCDFNIFTLVIVIKVSFHFEQINQTLKVIFCTDWNLYRDCILSKTINDSLY